MMADPITRKELEDVWNGVEVPVEETATTPEILVEEQPETPVELTADEQAVADAAAAEAKVEEDRLAVEKAEVDRLAAEKTEADRKAVEETAKKKERIVVEYQARDEQGNPIGNLTHLEADTWEEMSKKQEDAHVNAVRAYQRLKTRQITHKKVEEPKPSMTDDEIETAIQQIREENPQIAATAVRKLTGADEAEVERQKTTKLNAELAVQKVSYEFMRRHIHDFNSCEANAQIIGNYILANELEWTLDNLEHAFEQVESQLAPVSLPAAPVPASSAPANTEVSTPVVPTTVVPAVPAPTVPSVVTAEPAPVVPAPNTPLAQLRKVPSSGIVPGTTAGRPVVRVSPGLTKQDIAKMSPEDYRKLIRDPKRRVEVEKIIRGQ
jgi:hypothetical protein